MQKRLLNLVIVLAVLVGLIPSVALAAPQGQEETVYTVQKDDSLWAIAEKYLGNGAAYGAIVVATNAKLETDSSFAKIDNPSLIQPGWKILVPSAEEATKLVEEWAKAPAVGGELVTARPVPQRDLVVALVADPVTLDPHADANETTVNAVRHIFETLVDRDRDDMSIVPGLAESWEIPDPQTYVFKLREGVRFHNGEELTASDVKFTFERMLAFPSMKKYSEPLIESVEVIDDYTVQFKLKIPYAPFLRRMPTFHIVPEDYIKAVGDEEFARHPIGSGPYKFVEWVKDDHLTLEANEDYWGGAPEVKRAIFKPVPEPSTRVAALLAGEADIIARVEAEDVPRVEQGKDVRIEAIEDNRFMFYFMNSHKPPFDDVRVRQAVSYAIDWDTILQLFGGYAFRVPLPAHRGDFGYAEYADDLMPYTYNYDPDKARQLLAEAGYPNGFETTIETPIDNTPKDVEVTEVVAAQLAEVGIKAAVETYPWSVYYTERFNGVIIPGIGQFSMGNPIFDPDHLMSVHFDPDRRAYYFDMPELTELAHRGMATVDEKERVEIYRQAMRLILEQAPYAWGYGVKQIYGVRADINWTPRTDVRVFAFEVSFAK
jgi:peptide/nickel transport system substrate-binding protein